MPRGRGGRPHSTRGASLRVIARGEATLHRACVKYLWSKLPGVQTYRGDGGQQLVGGLAAYRLARLEGRMAGAPDLCVMVPGIGRTARVGFRSPE